MGIDSYLAKFVLKFRIMFIRILVHIRHSAAMNYNYSVYNSGTERERGREMTENQNSMIIADMCNLGVCWDYFVI